MDQLWHFTCEHGYRAIGKRGVLRPNRHPLLPDLDPMVWLTDQSWPSRDSVGLTSEWLTCDRMAYRYRARVQAPIWWPDIANKVSFQVRSDLESLGEPETWWVTFVPVEAVLA